MATIFADSYGFNAQDTSIALQAAINDPTADKIVVRNMGTPWLVSKTIVVPSNKEIVFEPNVIVRAKPESFTANDKPMFIAYDVDNVKFTGQGQGASQATLQMNKDEYTTNEKGHIINISGVNNYTISDLKLTGAGGDGIYISGATSNVAVPRIASQNGTIENIVSDNNRRQGLSIVSARDLTVRNSKFSNTSGTSPSAGIDLEPNVAGELLQNIKIENVDIRDNNGTGIKFALSKLDNSSAPVSIDINGATIDNNHLSGVSVNLLTLNDPSTTVNGTINIRNTNISRTQGDSTLNEPSAGIYIQALSGDQSDITNLKVNFEKVNITDTGNGRLSKSPIYIRGFGGPTAVQQIGNLAFKDVVVRDNFKRDILLTEIGRLDGYLNTVSGNITAFNPNGVTSDFDTRTPPQNLTLTIKAGTVDPTGIKLKNPSFNDNLTGWSAWNSTVSIVDRPGENKWAKIAAAGGGLGQDVTKDILTGQKYVVSGAAKLSQVGDRGILGVLFKDANGKIQETKSIDILKDNVESLQLGFTAPNNFASAQIFAWKGSGIADLFVDDFSLFKQSSGSQL